MKYVSSITAIVETSDWAELERMRRAISMRSRIVRPTLAKVGARLPPVSDWTDRADEKSRKVSSGTRCVQVRDRPSADRRPKRMRPTTSSSCGTQRAARFARGVFQGVGRRRPPPPGRPPSGRWRRPIGFRFCAVLPRGQVGLHLAAQQADDQADGDHERRRPSRRRSSISAGRQKPTTTARNGIGRETNGPPGSAPAADGPESSAGPSIRWRGQRAGAGVPPPEADDAEPSNRQPEEQAECQSWQGRLALLEDGSGESRFPAPRVPPRRAGRCRWRRTLRRSAVPAGRAARSGRCPATGASCLPCRRSPRCSPRGERRPRTAARGRSGARRRRSVRGWRAREGPVPAIKTIVSSRAKASRGLLA